MYPFNDILKHFPSSTQNNARSIVKNLLERYVTKPSYGVLKRLEQLNIGVETNNEGFYLIDKCEIDPLSDSELAELLKN